MKSNIKMIRAFSEIHPIPHFHIGHYIGVIKQWLYLQQVPNTICLWMIADSFVLPHTLPGQCIMPHIYSGSFII